MPTPSDTRSSPRKHFRYHILLFGTFCVLILIAFNITYHAVDEPYFGPPAWLLTLGSWLFLPAALLSFLAGIITLCTLPFRAHSPHRLPMILVLTSAILVAPILFVLDALPYCGLYPYHRLLANANALAQSSYGYADDHAGHFPPHPAVLIIRGYILPKELADYNSDPYDLPLSGLAESDWPTIAPTVDARSLFIYHGADLIAPPPPLDASIILAYTKPSRVLPDHHILAFADGHAQLVLDRDLLRFFTASNTARATLHLPPFSY